MARYWSSGPAARAVNAPAQISNTTAANNCLMPEYYEGHTDLATMRSGLHGRSQPTMPASRPSLGFPAPFRLVDTEMRAMIAFGNERTLWTRRISTRKCWCSTGYGRRSTSALSGARWRCFFKGTLRSSSTGPTAASRPLTSAQQSTLRSHPTSPQQISSSSLPNDEEPIRTDTHMTISSDPSSSH